MKWKRLVSFLANLWCNISLYVSSKSFWLFWVCFGTDFIVLWMGIIKTGKPQNLRSAGHFYLESRKSYRMISFLFFVVFLVLGLLEERKCSIEKLHITPKSSQNWLYFSTLHVLAALSFKNNPPSMRFLLFECSKELDRNTREMIKHTSTILEQNGSLERFCGIRLFCSENPVVSLC